MHDIGSAILLDYVICWNVYIIMSSLTKHHTKFQDFWEGGKCGWGGGKFQGSLLYETLNYTEYVHDAFDIHYSSE